MIVVTCSSPVSASLAVLIPLVGLWACGQSDRSAAPAVPGLVARIDTIDVSAAELREFVSGIPPTLTSEKGFDGARREYLRSLMAKRLLAMEASARGLDTVAAVTTPTAARWRRHLAGLYRREHLWPSIEVSEEEIQRYFGLSGMDHERELAGILVEEEEIAREIRRRLDSGHSFKDLAREYSIHEPSASRGGLLGFVSVEQAAALGIPRELFKSLAVGEPSGILPMGKRFEIVRFLQDRELALESQRAAISATLLREKRERVEQEAILSLAAELGWRPSAEGLRLLLARVSGQGFVLRKSLTVSDAATPLFQYEGGEVNVGDYVDALWSDPPRAHTGWGVRDSAEVCQVGADLLGGEALLVQAALRSGLAARPRELLKLRRLREEFAIRQMRRIEAVAKATVSTDEVEEYYQDHQDIFRRPEDLYLVEALVETRAEADSLVAQIGEGESLKKLAERHSVRPAQLWEKPGTVTLSDQERLAHPRFYHAAQQAQDGELVGPLEVDGGFSVFEVVGRSGGELLPLSEVDKRARALAGRQKREQLFDELVDGLMDRHERAITIYPAELEAALPDSFLKRLQVEDLPVSDDRAES